MSRRVTKSGGDGRCSLPVDGHGPPGPQVEMWAKDDED